MVPPLSFFCLQDNNNMIHSFFLQTRLAHERISELLKQLQSMPFKEDNLIHLAILMKFGFKPSTDANLMVNQL